MSDEERELFNILYWANRNLKESYFSQAQLGSMLSKPRSRKWINETLSKFEGNRIIESIYRHKKTCVYNVSSFFFDPAIAQKLCHLFREMFKFYFAFLLSLLPHANVTQSYYEVNKNINHVYINPSNSLKIYKSMPSVLRTAALTPQKKIEFMRFKEHILEKVFAASEFVACKDWAAWSYSECVKESHYQGIECDMKFVRELRKYRPLVEEVEKKMKASVRDKSVRTQSTAGSTPAARYPQQQPRIRESIKGEGHSSYIEWPGHPESKENDVSLSEAQFLNSQVEENMKQLKYTEEEEKKYGGASTVPIREPVVLKQNNYFTNRFMPKESHVKEDI